MTQGWDYIATMVLVKGRQMDGNTLLLKYKQASGDKFSIYESS